MAGVLPPALMYVYAWVHMYVCICACMCAYVFVRVCVHVLSKKHDYDVVNCGTPLVWSPNGYEIPFTQTMGHGVSKQPVISTTVYETPRKCMDLYEVPTAARGILRGGTQVADRGYDTPIDARNRTHGANEKH